MTRKRIEEILARGSMRLARRYRQIMQRIREQRSISELERALEAGQIADVLAEVEGGGQAVATEVAVIDTAIGVEVAAYIAERVNSIVSYSGTNPRAIARLQLNGQRLITAITEGQRLAIGEALSAGLSSGYNPREVARAIRDVIGLTPERAQTVANYRRALETLDRRALSYALRDARSDSAIISAIESGRALKPERIDRLVDRYYARQVASRAEVIARTEMLRSMSEATQEAYDQAIESGQLEVDRVQCEWHRAADARTRDSHIYMGGQLRRHGVPFLSGSGNLLRHPGDVDAPASDTIQCRCRKSWRVLSVGRSAVNRGGGYA